MGRHGAAPLHRHAARGVPQLTRQIDSRRAGTLSQTSCCSRSPATITSERLGTAARPCRARRPATPRRIMCRPDYRAKKQQNNVRPDTQLRCGGAPAQRHHRSRSAQACGACGHRAGAVPWRVLERLRLAAATGATGCRPHLGHSATCQRRRRSRLRGGHPGGRVHSLRSWLPARHPRLSGMVHRALRVAARVVRARGQRRSDSVLVPTGLGETGG